MTRLIDIATRNPVQTGAEKEFNLRKMDAGRKLDGTIPSAWDASLLGNVTQDLLQAGVAVKPSAQVAWTDLNDKGKAQWALAYKARHGNFPKMQALPGAEYTKIEFEKNGWIEVISNPFDDVDELADFLKNFGWGHVHTSFMRGGGPEVIQRQITWMRNANLWCFLDALATRGARGNDEDHWKFSIKGLSIPTEQHLELGAEILGGKNMFATAFSKHLIVNVRGSGAYGHRDRVGFETRGGTAPEKARIVDSLLDGLVNGNWGFDGKDGLRLLRLAPDELHYDSKRRPLQVKSLPREVADRIEAVKPGEGQRLYRFMAGSTFYPGGAQPEARLPTFDQRGGLPLLNYEDLPWLSGEERERVVAARNDFVEKLAALADQNPEPVARAQAIADLIVAWARESRLHEAFGRWLDGPNGEQKFIRT